VASGGDKMSKWINLLPKNIPTIQLSSVEEIEEKGLCIANDYQATLPKNRNKLVWVEFPLTRHLCIQENWTPAPPTL
jgi:hypothetical protein